MIKRWAAVVMGSLCCALISGCVGPGEGTIPSDSHDPFLHDLVIAALDAQPDDFQEPTKQRRDEVAQAVVELKNGHVRTLTDYALTKARSGRRLVQVFHEKNTPTHADGLYAVASGNCKPVVIQVPHPITDRMTIEMGLDLFEKSQACVLMVAGASRNHGSDAKSDPDTDEGEGNGSSDVAHNPATVFAAVSAALSKPRTTLVQVHAFASSGHPASYGDVVISAGESQPSQLIMDAAQAFEKIRMTTCVYDGKNCKRLAALTNVEGKAARKNGATFAHFEFSENVRDDNSRRTKAINALAEVLKK